MPPWLPGTCSMIAGYAGWTNNVLNMQRMADAMDKVLVFIQIV